jgi:hypothetical protein
MSGQSISNPSIETPNKIERGPLASPSYLTAPSNDNTSRSVRLGLDEVVEGRNIHIEIKSLQAVDTEKAIMQHQHSAWKKT